MRTYNVIIIAWNVIRVNAGEFSKLKRKGSVTDRAPIADPHPRLPPLPASVTLPRKGKSFQSSDKEESISHDTR